MDQQWNCLKIVAIWRGVKPAAETVLQSKLTMVVVACCRVETKPSRVSGLRRNG